MKKSILIIFLFFSNNYSFSQDTIFLKENVTVFNYVLDMPNYQDVFLDTTNFDFDGFLIIKIDSLSRLDTADPKGGLYYTELFWINSLNEILNQSSKYYYSINPEIISLLSFSYDNGEINKVTSFAKYYKLYNKANENKVDVFLYKQNGAITTNHIIDLKNFWSSKENPNIYYGIYKCRFETAIFTYKFGSIEKRTFLPISYLKEIRPIYDQEMNNFDLHKSGLDVVGY